MLKSRRVVEVTIVGDRIGEGWECFPLWLLREIKFISLILRTLTDVSHTRHNLSPDISLLRSLGNWRLARASQDCSQLMARRSSYLFYFPFSGEIARGRERKFIMKIRISWEFECLRLTFSCSICALYSIDFFLSLQRLFWNQTLMTRADNPVISTSCSFEVGGRERETEVEVDFHFKRKSLK